MDKYIFTSSLSNNEIESAFNDIDFFSGIVASLIETHIWEKGQKRMTTIQKVKVDKNNVEEEKS